MPPNSAETKQDRIILLAHGGGGELTNRFIAQHLLPPLSNPALNALGDAGAIEAPSGGGICLTTDSFVVRPLVFPGGDIGRLAVCGTINDLAVAGAKPLGLSLALIMEEGLPLAVLDRVIASVAAAAAEADTCVVTGDTKVIERREGDGLLITTAGVGQLREGICLDLGRIEPGDVVVISGRIAEHGLAVMSVREGLAFDTDLVSDVAPLNGLVSALLDSGADVKFMRDPTRSGLAGTLADLLEGSGLSIEVAEAAVPISAAARHMAEVLGLDPLTVANEGKVVFVIPPGDLEKALHACRRHPLGTAAAVVGRFTEAEPPLVELISRAGGRRIVQRPYGEELPRIC